MNDLMMKRRRFLSHAALAVAGLASRPVLAHGPEADLWPRWEAHDAQSTTRIDHAKWRRFLLRYLVVGEDGVNRVRYGAVSQADRRHLDNYIERLGELTIAEHNRGEQFAYWINLYNAVTLAVVLDHYPVASMMDISISPGIFSRGPWGKKMIHSDGETLSLDDIEHRILRPIWRDTRIHYAVNCAAIGCPNLRRSAFTGANVEPLLTIAAKDFINHPRGVDLRDGKLYVSSLYDWYAEDFGGGDAAIIEHLRGFARPRLAAALKEIDEISGDAYDWSLNDAS
jgi:hypothetical protein